MNIKQHPYFYLKYKCRFFNPSRMMHATISYNLEYFKKEITTQVYVFIIF